MHKKQDIASQLVRYYVARGMTDRLAESILICRYLEAILEPVSPNRTGRIQPVFDYAMHTLRDDWRKFCRNDLWLDTVSGRIVDTLPPTDGEPDLNHIHLPKDTQSRILFGRFANLFLR